MELDFDVGRYKVDLNLYDSFTLFARTVWESIFTVVVFLSTVMDSSWNYLIRYLRYMLRSLLLQDG